MTISTHPPAAGMKGGRQAGPPQFTVDHDALLEDVARLYRCHPARIMGATAQSRTECVEMAKPRQVVIIVYRACGYSQPAIGRIMGRDHSSIRYALTNGVTPVVMRQAQELALKHATRVQAVAS